MVEILSMEVFKERLDVVLRALGDTVGIGHRLDSMISEAFPILMILWFYTMPSNKTRETAIN